MRVLVVDEALPFPPNSGKRIRTAELLTRLARRHEITLCYHDEGTPPVAEEAAQDAGLKLLPVPRPRLEKHGPRFAWDLLRNVFLPVPYMVMAHRTKALRHAIERFATEARPDLVHVEWTPLIANVPRGLGVPTCVAAHNVEADIWRRYRQNERSWPRKAYIALQHRKVARYERAALQRADAVTAVSEHDAERIVAWAGQPHVVVVPNGVNASTFRRDPNVAVDPDEVLFVGSLDWRPNLDAVTWFVDEILARLRAQRATAHLTVVGRNPPAWLRARADQTEGLTLHPDVPDVRPHVARAAVCAVPLRIGGGSRLKICEALAMERPVVSTTVGAEGLDLGEGIVIADGAEAFAAALADALANPAPAQARALEGRTRVLARYEWDRIAPLQETAWSEMVARVR